MFKSLKLKSKLLLSFFIITCISTIATTVFSIYYFSGKIKVEALENMRKNMQVAELIYENKLSLIHDTANKLAQDGTFQILVGFLTVGDKIPKYLNEYAQQNHIHNIVAVNKERTLIGHVDLEKTNIDHQNIDYSHHPLINYALTQNQSMVTTERINDQFIAITAVSPIFKSSKKNNRRSQKAPEVMGAVLLRYYLNYSDDLIIQIESLLGLTAAVYYDGVAINSIHSTNQNNAVAVINPKIYEKLMHTISQFEQSDIEEGSQLAEYKTLFGLDDKAVAVLGISVSADKYVDTYSEAVSTLSFIMLLCIIVASILGFLLARSILIPIEQLLNGVKRVTSGDLSHKIDVDLKDELGVLASSFNGMAKQLNELFNTLEQRIEDATKKLQNTLAHMTAIIDNMADGLLVTDLEGKIIRVNPALHAMFPEKKNKIGKTCDTVFNTEISTLVHQAQTGGGEIFSAEINLINERISKAVGTAIIQKDALSDEGDNKYIGTKCIGSVILMRDITREKEIDLMLTNTVNTLTLVGTALSAEKDFSRLLEMVVEEACRLTNADAGTLYILEDEHLRFEIIHNKSLGIHMGGYSGEAIHDALQPIHIDEQRIVADCARSKETLHNNHYNRVYKEIMYQIFAGYQVKEVLVIPMLDRMKNTVGVLQLINPLDHKTQLVKPFENNQIEIVYSLASQAAVAIENTRNIQKIQDKTIAFERFVPTEFLRHLDKTEVEDIQLGDASHESMSVLFADIRSFTTLSETMSPEENFLFLNDYLKFIGPNITNNRGFIDKYIGDAIMALFPDITNTSADDAVYAAVGMQTSLQDFNAHRIAQGKNAISIGIGVHTGPLTLGTIGFESRMESTVIGDTVNLASRIEGLTKMYGISLGITSTTLADFTNPEQFLVREIDTVQVKGKEEPITVYEVFNADAEDILSLKLESLDKYNKALDVYKSQKWEEAFQLFSELVSVMPEDKATWVYLQRCENFKNNPPDLTWQGVTRLDSK